MPISRPAHERTPSSQHRGRLRRPASARSESARRGRTDGHQGWRRAHVIVASPAIAGSPAESNPNNPLAGVFNTRSPDRPNPLAFTVTVREESTVLVCTSVRWNSTERRSSTSSPCCVEAIIAAILRSTRGLTAFRGLRSGLGSLARRLCLLRATRRGPRRRARVVVASLEAVCDRHLDASRASPNHVHLLDFEARWRRTCGAFTVRPRKTHTSRDPSDARRSSTTRART